MQKHQQLVLDGLKDHPKISLEEIRGFVKILKDDYGLNTNIENKTFDAKSVSLAMCTAWGMQQCEVREKTYFDIFEDSSSPCLKYVKSAHKTYQNDDTLSLLKELHSQLRVLGTSVSTYFKLVARLSKFGSDLTPMDAYSYYTLGSDIRSDLLRRIDKLKQEKEFWTKLNQISGFPTDLDETDIEIKRSCFAPDSAFRSEREALEHLMAEYNPSIAKNNAQWNEKKSQLSAQVYARLMSTKYRVAAKQMSDKFPPSRFKSDVSRQKELYKLRSLGDVFASTSGFRILYSKQ